MSSSDDVLPIIDNQKRKLGNFLRHEIDVGAALSFVSAYFTIYGYGDLKDQLEQAGELRFLYGDPRHVGAVDPSEADAKAFGLTAEAKLNPKHALQQKGLAKACQDWIEGAGSRVQIRKVIRENFLHGKMYHVARGQEDSVAVAGSSNFTRSGLGTGANPNIELNLEAPNDRTRDALLQWFNSLWEDEQLTGDAKGEVIEALQRLGGDYSPQFVYYKTLFHVLKDRLEAEDEREGLIEGVRLYDSAIWNKLYEFQKDGAKNAINRLLRHNGCIVADSVGLGKTFTAIAVIKYFEARNERVLVLCPKRLEANWTRYTSLANQTGNPFAEDRLGYTVLAHTDLSYYEGKRGPIDLANFNWSAFDLIVIDESHNFRNEGKDKKDNDGQVIKLSRYNRLLKEVLKDGVKTKVLMLSATPVNTTLRDLRNQIYLMTEKHQGHFKEALGISSIKNVFAVAERAFRKWEKERSGHRRDKNELLGNLGAGFLTLLDAITIARSRAHIHQFYPEVEKKLGGFPVRAKPTNLHPPTDTMGELSYDKLHEEIGDFRLAVYRPSTYKLDSSDLEDEKRRLNFDQRDREDSLVSMIRINLLKRLESSVCSFSNTLERITKKMTDLDSKISRWKEKPSGFQVSMDLYADEEDEDFSPGKGRRYALAELNLDKWQADLAEDIKVFQSMLARAKKVTPERDAKLAELKKLLRRKVEEAPPDKEGRPNRKVLVFTTFSDTAAYLYENLAGWARNELDVHLAMVTGSKQNRTTTGGKTDFSEILGSFSPKAQEVSVADGGEEVDILIATDCLSEGQNLQDCDLIVNYDIHWNPVRLMQRFGRIDRIGSKNTKVKMTNFWPTKDLDSYLNLEDRVKARMALADATGTGKDDLLDIRDFDEAREAEEDEMAFRASQLRRLREETLDLEEVDDGISLSDFTLDTFLADLRYFLQKNQKELEAAPDGIYGLVPPRPTETATSRQPLDIRPGVILCLKQKVETEDRTPNQLHPYFLTYVSRSGAVVYTFQHVSQVLTLFRALAQDRPDVDEELVPLFDNETDKGRDMRGYEKMVGAGVRGIVRAFRKAQMEKFDLGRDAVLLPNSQWPLNAADFDLITWLVIHDGEYT